MPTQTPAPMTGDLTQIQARLRNVQDRARKIDRWAMSFLSFCPDSGWTASCSPVKDGLVFETPNAAVEELERALTLREHHDEYLARTLGIAEPAL